MKKFDKSVPETNIRSEADLDRALGEQNTRQRERLRRTMKGKRTLSAMLLLLAVAAYLEWHITKGQSDLLGTPFIHISVVSTLALAATNLVKPTP